MPHSKVAFDIFSTKPGLTNERRCQGAAEDLAKRSANEISPQNGGSHVVSQIFELRSQLGKLELLDV